MIRAINPFVTNTHVLKCVGSRIRERKISFESLAKWLLSNSLKDMTGLSHCLQNNSLRGDREPTVQENLAEKEDGKWRTCLCPIPLQEAKLPLSLDIAWLVFAAWKNMNEGSDKISA
jgi:hypothetical protein